MPGSGDELRRRSVFRREKQHIHSIEQRAVSFGDGQRRIDVTRSVADNEGEASRHRAEDKLA